MQILRNLCTRFHGEITAVGIFLASRVVTFLAFSTAAYVAKTTLLAAMFRWDATWYARIVERGYPDNASGENSIAFFPLYPRILDVVSRLTRMNVGWSGVVVNLLLGAVLAVVFWRLALRLTNRPVATRAVALFMFFPGSFVLTMGYSEALMLVLAAACLLFLVEERWLLAGIAAAFATATRPNAIALVLACAVGAAVAIYRARMWKSLVAPLLAPLGFLAYMLFVWRRTGAPFGWWRVQSEGWQQQFDFGWTTLHRARAFVNDPFSSPNETISLFGVLVLAFLCYLLVRWRPPYSVLAYTLGVVALAVGSSAIGGQPRFILVAFPLFIALARVVRRNVYATTVGVFGGGLALIIIMVSATLAVTP